MGLYYELELNGVRVGMTLAAQKKHECLDEQEGGPTGGLDLCRCVVHIAVRGKYTAAEIQVVSPSDCQCVNSTANRPPYAMPVINLS